MVDLAVLVKIPQIKFPPNLFICVREAKADIEMNVGQEAEEDPGIFFRKSLIRKAVVALRLKVFVLTSVQAVSRRSNKAYLYPLISSTWGLLRRCFLVISAEECLYLLLRLVIDRIAMIFMEIRHPKFAFFDDQLLVKIGFQVCLHWLSQIW